jgi:hypothetical protein
LESLENRTLPTVTLQGNFTGMNNTGWTPPDTNLAVGPSHVVETVNESLAIYDKATGTLLSKQTLVNLFTGFDTTGGEYDPEVLFDEQAGRFVVEAAVSDSGNHKAFIDVAVSNSSDPTQGFTQKQQFEVDEGGQYWADNGKLGWNADAYVYTANGYTFAGSYAHEIVLTIDKSSLLSSSTVTSYLVDRSGNVSMVAARMHGSTAGGPLWFVESNWNGGSSVDVVRMDKVLSSSPTFTDNVLSVNAYSYVAPTQPGGTVDAGDSRMLNVEWNNNNLVAAFDSSVGSDTAAAWCEFNTGGSAPVLSQQGVIHPGTGISTFFPAVGVDASGNLGLNYMESSATEYVSMYITGRLPGDAAGTLEPALLARAGAVTLNPTRAGDYAGIGLDPSTANTFWAANEYAPSGSAWGTWMAQFQVANPSGNQPPTVATPASATPSPVTGTTTSLSVLGADDTGEANLAYTWSGTSQPAGATIPSFSVNGTNAAKNSTATFYQAGNYTFLATITDPGGLTASSSVTVTVNPTCTTIAVSPASMTMPDGSKQQFAATALDQFGNALASQPSFTWSLASGSLGSVNSTGLYTAPNSGDGSATVCAVNASLTGTASVTVSSLPAAPTNLTAKAVAPTQVNLAWSEASTNVTGFNIQRSSNNGKSWSTLAQVGGSVLTYSDKAVSRNKTYQYRVDAYNSVGTSPWSNVATVTTPTQTPQPDYPDPDVPERIPPGDHGPGARKRTDSTASGQTHTTTDHPSLVAMTASAPGTAHGQANTIGLVQPPEPGTVAATVRGLVLNGTDKGVSTTRRSATSTAQDGWFRVTVRSKSAQDDLWVALV